MGRIGASSKELPVEPSASANQPAAKFTSSASGLDTVPVPLERDVFLRTLLRHLAGTLQDVVGTEEASGFISIVGLEMGREIDRMYKAALGVERLTRAQVSDVLVDLKARIQGDFFVVEEDDEKIVLGNRLCPFADKVIGRPTLCMMTSNVFGSITAQNLGYAKVVVEEAIAQGHPGCRVAVYLKPTATSDCLAGREYFSDE
jgi:predicted ArsR family transcriptional regulator